MPRKYRRWTTCIGAKSIEPSKEENDDSEDDDSSDEGSDSDESNEMLRYALRGSHSISPLPIHNANPLTTFVSSKIDEPNFHLLLDLLSDLPTNAIVLFRLMCFAGFIKKIRIPFWLLLPAWLAYIVDISLYISNLAGIQEGKDAIVEEGGIVALVELD
uniref:Uncharacterized protein n=1 Tax=Cucumis melo TaxID=3656 RepID=A0A9I9E5U1_CUCME